MLPGTRIYAEHGIAVSFDFGNNILGQATEYRGSYIRELDGQAQALLPELNGPLVSTVDLTGRLAGRFAAIYLSDTGYVRQINAMTGAALAGDMNSHYARVDATHRLRLTALTFGQAAGPPGRETAQAEPHFRLVYDGNIVGRNLPGQFAGGTTRLRGTHLLYDAGVAPRATLAGNGSFTPRMLAIHGDYVQTPSGTLQAGVSGTRAISQLLVNGSVALEGTLAIAPQRSRYGKNFSLSSDQWLVATRTTGAFANVSAPLASPTLTATASAQGNGAYRIDVVRAPTAYSRYGAGPNEQQLGGGTRLRRGYGRHRATAARRDARRLGGRRQLKPQRPAATLARRVWCDAQRCAGARAADHRPARRGRAGGAGPR